MKKLQNKMLLVNILFITLCIMAVVSIPALVVGIVVRFNLSVLLIVLGIIFILLGIFVFPFVAISRSETSFLLKLNKLITQDNIFSVTELSKALNISSKYLTSKISLLMAKGYLTNYTFKTQNELRPTVSLNK